MRSLLLLLGIFVFLPVGAYGQVQVQIHPTQVEYYQLESSAYPALLDEMTRVGPQDQHGRRRHALTSWQLRWNIHPRDKLLIDKVELSLSSQLVFPQPDIELSQEDEDRWTEYFSALARHEAQHLDLAIRHIEELAQALRQVEKLADAEELLQYRLTLMRASDLRLDRQSRKHFAQLRK